MSGSEMAYDTAAVAAPRPGAEAGREILQRGGNAVDAAVGAMLTCCVAMPGAVGLGGYGGSAVVYLAREKHAIAIDFDSRAPLAYRSELFRGDPAKYETGYLSITVPAVVAGLAAMLQRCGTFSWSELCGPAIALAEGGVPITADRKRQLDDWAKKADPVSLSALFPDRNVPGVGSVWIQRDMARFLRRLAEDGPGTFYDGDIPRTIVRQVQQHGGILSEEDFVRYRPQVSEPLGIDYRGFRVLTPQPPSGGVTTLQILKTLEHFELSKIQPGGADYLHLFVEAAKLAWLDREKYLGDPELTPIPYDQLLSEDTTRENANRIRLGRVIQAGTVMPPSPSHTVNVVAADAVGNVVSLTATQGYLFGSTVAIAGLGLVMGHGMSRFTLAAGSPNAPAAGKRMHHNMSPTVILGPDGRARGAVGLAGGPRIVTVTAQLVVNLIDFYASPAGAVQAPRVHVETDEPVSVSAVLPDTVVAELRALGHTVLRGQEVGGPPEEIGGQANALAIDPKTGAMSAATGMAGCVDVSPKMQ